MELVLNVIKRLSNWIIVHMGTYSFLLGSPRIGCEEFEGIAIPSNRAVEILLVPAGVDLF